MPHGGTIVFNREHDFVGRAVRDRGSIFRASIGIAPRSIRFTFDVSDGQCPVNLQLAAFIHLSVSGAESHHRVARQNRAGISANTPVRIEETGAVGGRDRY